MSQISVTTEEKLIDSKKSHTVLRGEILNVTKDKVQVCIDNDRRLRINIPIIESTLYVPSKIREREDAFNLFIEGYAGSEIAFVVTDIIRDESGNVTEAKGSMIEAREIGIKEIKGMNLPAEITVNILLVRDKYMVVEYKGLIQTVGTFALAKTEILSMQDYVRENRNNGIDKFVLKGIANENVGSMELDRYAILDDEFLEKINGGEYKEGDCCKGVVTGKDISGRMIIEIEPAISGVAHIPDGLNIDIGAQIQCLISGVDKAKHRLFLRRIKVLA
ncbi:hypothetical protein [Clostridium thermobutyricum]|uniref:hypothetical protein n=1 Tax=Clostridium thermobutyricum TaxID=29372 RepID=UPI0018AB34F0|nr:hypothetical protein [Clostridium thermobutyricum]